jgi:hypothetical protein
MSDLPLILALLLSGGAAIGFVAVVVGIKRQDKAMSLGAPLDGRSASLARRVTGCHTRGIATSAVAPQASTRPARGAATGPVRRCVVL